MSYCSSWQGESFSGEPGESGKAIRAFNEAVVADPNINVVVLPVRDGISLITRKQNATSDRYSLTGQVCPFIHHDNTSVSVTEIKTCLTAGLLDLLLTLPPGMILL